MSSGSEVEIQLEQALLSVLVAADQLGVDSEDLRLIAIGGILGHGSWSWVDNDQALGTVAVLNRAAESLGSN